MKIQFCGAADGVTGSCHLVTAGTETDPVRILLDCGQFQGGKKAEAQNYDPFPFDAKDVDFVILSHAHVDHCGRLPLLLKRGFEGSIYCTDATADLAAVILRDAAHIQEKEAEWKSRKAERTGLPPVAPLYTMKDAEAVLTHLVPVLYDQLVSPLDGVHFVMNDAGHILGSAIVELWTTEDGDVSKLVFSGDIGSPDMPMLRDPVRIKKADYVIMESTYGGRLHDAHTDSVKRLAEVLVNITGKGGTVVVPSFAVGRTQEFIYECNNFLEHDTVLSRKLKDIRIYIDSPMAISATEVFSKNAQVFDDEFRNKLMRGDDPLDFENLIFTRTTEESMALNRNREPKVIISASGMCEAGRIRHHLKHHLWRKEDAVVFIGYQGAGTLGREIVEGARSVSLFGEEVLVRAKIYNLEGFSAHADHAGLMDWVHAFQMKPSAFFLVHGEAGAKEALAKAIANETKIAPTVVTGISEFVLSKDGITTIEQAMQDIVDEDDLLVMKRRISDIRSSLDVLLAKAEEAASDGNAAGANYIAEINNKLLALEKDTIGLAASEAKK
jgi:metallo-beta-lactamase family protein